MFKKKDITMGQLAQSALGGSELGSLQIMLFHSLINLTLKKLDCENEKVTLSGIPADSLRKLLKKSCLPVSLIDDETIETPMKDYRKLDELEKKITTLELELDKHLAKQDIDPHSDKPCLEVCEVEEVKDEELAALRKNEWFFDRLKERLTQPLTCRCNRLEVDLKILTDKMKVFQKECAYALEKMNALDELETELVNLHTFILEDQSKYKMTMIEVQDSMDSKVNTRDILEVKANIRKMIDRAEACAQEAVYMHTKPRAIAACVPVSINGEMLPIKKTKPQECLLKTKESVCYCDIKHKQEDSSLLERVKKIDPRKVTLRHRPSVKTTGSVTLLN